MNTRRPDLRETLASRLRLIVAPEYVISDPETQKPYECDALTLFTEMPMLVVLPEDTQQVQKVMAVCHEFGVSVVARGAGTGLCAGSTPHAEGVLLSLTRMKQILDIDPLARTAKVQPGVRNLAVSEAAKEFGLYYGPDPSSQIACSIGGNVAENSGGVHCLKYGLTVHIGRQITEKELVRPFKERLLLRAIRQVLPYADRFGVLLKVGQIFRPVLPSSLKQKVPKKVTILEKPERRHERFILALAGCAQPSATPNTNISAARVLDRLGISLIEVTKAGCCGAVDQHLGEPENAKAFMRNNIDAWWPEIENGAEAIVSLASGCGVMLKEYGRCLADDPEYAEKANRVSELVCDIGDILLEEDLTQLTPDIEQLKIAVHCPCTLQHGFKKTDTPKAILQKMGFNLVETKDSHLCCGSAGTYSLLQPEISQKLLDNSSKQV